jgi:hypothetical protein
MVVHQIEVTYPRQFNFGMLQLEFALPANTTGNYLEITGFDHGGVAPVLYDLTNGKRYVVDISLHLYQRSCFSHHLCHASW